MIILSNIMIFGKNIAKKMILGGESLKGLCLLRSWFNVDQLVDSQNLINFRKVDQLVDFPDQHVSQ